jgi:hypothetical protein
MDYCVLLVVAWVLARGTVAENTLRASLMPVFDLKDLQPYMTNKQVGKENFVRLRDQLAGQVYYMNAQIDLKSLRLGVSE